MNRKSQKGQTLVMAALALIVLLGFAGLAVDMGVLRYEKRLQQSAADAAAIAGASNIPYGGIVVAGQKASAANGFADTGGGNVSNCTSSAAVGTVCVEVRRPPTTGKHIGDLNYVEAVVAAVHTTHFMKVFAIDREPVTARAVATSYSGGNDEGCLYTLGPATGIKKDVEGVASAGNAKLKAPNCAIIDNGNFDTSGRSFEVCASSFSVSGSWLGSEGSHCPDCVNIGDPSCTGTGTHTPQQGTAPAQDPLSYLRPPCSPCTVVAGSDIHITGGGGYTGPAGSVSYSDGVYTVVPGTYNSISVGSSGNTVNFSPGTYVINGMGGCPAACLNVQGGNTLNGSSVMFYFTNQATVNFTGTANVQLSPQSTGDYAGILFYQDPNDTNVDGPRLGGDNGSSFDGVLYFPKDNLTFFGTNVSYSTGMVISGAIELSGNPTVTLEGAAGLPPGVNIVKNAILVE